MSRFKVQKRTVQHKVTVDVKAMREAASKRLNEDLSQDDCAEIAGVNPRTWSRWESPNHKSTIPASVVRVFWYEVGIELIVEGFLGKSVAPEDIRKYLHELADEWDVKQQQGEVS